MLLSRDRVEWCRVCLFQTERDRRILNYKKMCYRKNVLRLAILKRVKNHPRATAESGAEFVFSRPSATGAYFAYVTERERRRQRQNMRRYTRSVNTATAETETPSSRPTIPSFSVVVADILTLSSSTSIISAKFFCIAGI